MDWYFYILIPLAGLVAGFINVLAGSGSLITLPVLTLALQGMGLPDATKLANGTNRFSVMLQTGVALRGFNKKKLVDWRGVGRLVIPIMAGSLIGANIAANIKGRWLDLAIAVLMIVMLVVIFLKPKHWLEGRPDHNHKFTWTQMGVFFAIGLYAGFIQAGTGIFLLTSLVLVSGYDLVKANSLKVALNFFQVIISLSVFFYHGQVIWLPASLLAVGSMAGAYVATHMAIKKGAAFVRWALIIVIILATGYYLIRAGLN